jgi:hypothetical protein
MNIKYLGLTAVLLAPLPAHAKLGLEQRLTIDCMGWKNIHTQKDYDRAWALLGKADDEKAHECIESTEDGLKYS